MATEEKKLTNEGKWLRPYFRGTLAVISIGGTVAMLLMNSPDTIPSGWWALVSGIAGFYFGGDQ